MDPMIAALLRPEAYDHPVERIELLETHISWVLLTGPYAYKLKKPVNLGFVDFSTPERRRRFCQEELRLNRRLAPDLYLGLRVVHGPPAQASLHGDGPPLELALQMRQFAQRDLLPAALERGAVRRDHLLELADRLAGFHAGAATADPSDPSCRHGSPGAVRAPARANLEVLAEQRAPERSLAPLAAWTEAEGQRLSPHFRARKAAGAIRECHGDLHLGNMVLHRGRIEVFDCLEFSEALRWIDPISDLAFLAMDLELRGRAPLALDLLQRWLETSGDYEGLPAWRWYLVYRALVRAKVTALRLAQAGADDPAAAALLRQRDDYLGWALATSRPEPAPLLLTHGVSGSGKSHLAQRLAGKIGAIRIRSDVERRRLFGRWGTSRGPVLSGDPYRPEVSRLLFEELLPVCAEAALAGGLPVIVDATFLCGWQRRPFLRLAERLGLPWLILDCRCDPSTARRRILDRAREGRDPSEADPAVLEGQLAYREPLSAEELEGCLRLDTAAGEDVDRLAGRIRARLRTTRERRLRGC